MSDLQGQLKTLKSMEGTPEVLLTSSLNLFQNLTNSLDHIMSSDQKSNIRKYYQFLIECYKLFEKALLTPDFLQRLADSSRAGLVALLIRQFLIVWITLLHGHDDILTLKLWMNLLQKLSILKNAPECLWISKVFLETFYPQALSKDQSVKFELRMIKRNLQLDAEKQDLKLSRDFLSRLTQSINVLSSDPSNFGLESFRILLNVVALRVTNLTYSDKTFSFANINEWELLVTCYQLLWKLYREDAQRVADLFKIFFKDYFRLMYKFSTMALDRGLIDSQAIWRLRTESFIHVIEMQVFDLNDVGNYLIDTIRKMTQGANSNLIASFQKNITRALGKHGKKSFQSKNILFFYSRILTYFEENYESKEFFKMISFLINQEEESDIPEEFLCSVEFWTQNMSKSQYLPSVISFVLGKLLKRSNSSQENISLLFTPEIVFCMKGLQILSRLKVLQEPPKDQDPQLEYMISRLTNVYNLLEKIKMSILTEFLNKKFILSILEGQFAADETMLVPRIIKKLQETSGLSAISDLFEIQPRIYKILSTKENSNPNRFVSVSINNKFYNLLYLILTRKFDPALVNFPGFKKALQEYLGAIFLHKENLTTDSNLLKDIQSSIHYLSKALEILSNTGTPHENISLTEDVILTIYDLSLFEIFDIRLVGGISNSLCKTLKNSAGSSTAIQCLFKLYKALFNTLQNMIKSTQTLEQKDNMHRLFEMLAFTEIAIIRVGSFIPELAPAEMEVEGAMVSQNPILKQLASFEWSYVAKKLLLKARIRVLLSLFADESITGHEICSLFYLIEHDLQEIIRNCQDNLKVIKYQILWLEVLYILIAKKSEMQGGKDMETKALDQALWRFAKQFSFSRTQTPLKQEEMLMKVLKDGISKKLEEVAPTSPKKQFRFHLINSDVSRKMVYLHIYIGLQESEENLKIENLAKRTSVILHDFRNALGAFYSVLSLEEKPNKSFQDYMTTWLGKRSEPRTAITKVLNDMKVSDALKIQKFLSSFIEIADYLYLLDETENLLKIAIVYWICLGTQFSKGFDKKTRAIFNTRIQLLFAIMQIKLAIVYQKKSNPEDSEKCFKNFEDSYQKERVENSLQLIDQDPQYQSFFIELKGLTLHLDSLIYEYQIRTNQPGAFENFKQFLQKLDKDPKIEKLRSSALMILKANLLLYSGQLLYSSGHPAYSIQEVRKCLDYLINYGFNYAQNQGIDQILSKQMDAKPDRFDRLCLLDLKYLNEATQFTKELCQSSSSESENVNTVANILNMLFPKNFALNFSKLSVLSMMARTMKKLSKISYNIGLLSYSEYYSDILKNYTLKTTQSLPYIKIMTRENIKKQENDASSSLQKEDRIAEINKVIDIINTLACPIGYNLKVLPNQKRTFSWNQKLFDTMHNDLSKAAWVDSTWVDALTQYMKSTIMAYSSHNEKENENSSNRSSKQKAIVETSHICEIFKEFAKPGKSSETRMLSKDWFKSNHLQCKAKPFEFWGCLMKSIDERASILSAEKGYTFEGFVWHSNCLQIIRHIIYKTSLLHSPLTKQALVLKQTLYSLMRKYLAAIFESRDFTFLKELSKVSQLECACGEQAFGIMGEQVAQNFGDSFNQEIDFWITCSDVVFTYKHQIKNIRKVLKSNKGGDKKTERDDLKYIRKSLKTLKINPENTDSSEIKFLSNLKDVVERDFEEYSVKSTNLTQNISKFLGDSPILILKFIKKKKQKMLFIAKVFKDPKKNVCFIISDPYKTNFLNDLLLDFSKIVANIENDLDETSKAQKNENEKANLNASQWWKERFTLDKRMESLLKALEDTIGLYKGVMLGDFVDENLNSWIDENYKTLEMMLLKYIENNLGMGLYSTLFKELKRDVSSYIHVLKGFSVLSVLEKHTEGQFKAGFEEINENVNICFKILSQTQQAEFKSIVMDYRANLVNQFEGKNLKRNPVVLLLDENFQFLPFECMPLFLAQSQSFLRIPSLEYIRSIQHEQNYVNLKDTSYVLNPSKDLKATQERFQEFLQKKETWNGIIGREPPKEFLKQALTQNECYLYIGHGAGEKYFNENELKEIMKIKSAVLLIGCSSAKQVKVKNYISKGEAELAGISIEYLLSNCPFLVGNLWDVTDKDMDAMTEFILEAATTPNSVSDFLDLLQQARNQSKMKYLNGSALVCYGVPLGFVYN